MKYRREVSRSGETFVYIREGWSFLSSLSLSLSFPSLLLFTKKEKREVVDRVARTGSFLKTFVSVCSTGDHKNLWLTYRIYNYYQYRAI